MDTPLPEEKFRDAATALTSDGDEVARLKAQLAQIEANMREVTAVNVLLVAAVENIQNKLNAEVAQKADLIMKNAQLETTANRANEAAMTDHVTGIRNRRGFLEAFANLVRKSKRRDFTGVSSRIVVAFCDLDKFKNINDTHGHQTGDVVLSDVAASLETASRTEDCVARWGGDEFVVLLDTLDSTLESVKHMAERQLERFQNNEWRGADEKALPPGTVGISMGVVIWDDVRDIDPPPVYSVWEKAEIKKRNMGKPLTKKDAKALQDQYAKELKASFKKIYDIADNALMEGAKKEGRGRAVCVNKRGQRLFSVAPEPTVATVRARPVSAPTHT
jgi:diguanylate cyclase (GGDEF)-like protein